MGAILGSTYKLPMEMGSILGSCVPAPTRDPTSRAVPEHWGCDHNSLVLSVEMGAILGRCVPAPTGDLSSCINLNTGPTKVVTTTDQFNDCHGPGQMIF
ncbi:hypothetical protein EMCRGX_G001013 [Ephydatia muelleri]